MQWALSSLSHGVGAAPVGGIRNVQTFERYNVGTLERWNIALGPIVGYNMLPATAGYPLCEDTMLEELMQTGESEMERILRLRGYL